MMVVGLFSVLLICSAWQWLPDEGCLTFLHNWKEEHFVWVATSKISRHPKNLYNQWNTTELYYWFNCRKTGNRKSKRKLNDCDLGHAVNLPQRKQRSEVQGKDIVALFLIFTLCEAISLLRVWTMLLWVECFALTNHFYYESTWRIYSLLLE